MKLEWSMYLRKVCIEVPGPGVYVFQGASDTGKSFLCNMMMEIADDTIGSFTYSDYRAGRFPNLVGKKWFMLDRYDMYRCDKIDELMNKYRDNCVILVDIKHREEEMRVTNRTVFIELGERDLCVRL